MADDVNIFADPDREKTNSEKKQNSITGRIYLKLTREKLIIVRTTKYGLYCHEFDFNYLVKDPDLLIDM